MFLGIDFGTTNTVVARLREGEPSPTLVRLGGTDTTPSAVAIDSEGRFVFGQQALSCPSPCLGIKNLLREHKGRSAPIAVFEGPEGAIERPLIEVLTAFFAWLLAAIRADLEPRGMDLPEHPPVVLTVPQNCHDLQRRATRDAATAAGFAVLDILNEPGAAALGLGATGVSVEVAKGDLLLVYDFGGGTFDASLLRRLGDERFSEVDSEGVRRCGGGDVDDTLLEGVLDDLGGRKKVAKSGWTPDGGQRTRLARLVEKAKIDLAGEDDLEAAAVTLANVIGTRSKHASLRKEVVSVSHKQLEEAAKPIVKKTMIALGKLLKRNETVLGRLAAVVLTGGSSALPGVVAGVERALKRYGCQQAAVLTSDRRAHDVAVGAAVFAAGAGSLQRRTALHFGVWRVEHGQDWFHVLLPRGTELGDEAVDLSVAYTPTHDIGAFRYCQCSELVDGDGQPVVKVEDQARRDLRPGGEVLEYPRALRVPFAADIRDLAEDELCQRPIHEVAPTVTVEERYEVAADGIVDIAVAIDDEERSLSLDFTASREELQAG